MSSPTIKERALEERILIVAPRGRDAHVVQQVLSGSGLECVVCPDVAGIMPLMEEGAACVLIADEALDPQALRFLEDWLGAQPPWSDFPFVLLVGNGKKGVSTAEGRRLAEAGNVMLIERPVSGEALVSSARSALRARRRQYQARAMIAERAATNARLLRTARQKDEFLAMLAHELRNPLAPVLNAAEAIRIQESGLPPRVRWAREIVERQSRHLARLLDDLLDVSRITTGKITLKRVPVELRSILTAAADVARLSIDARHHVLAIDLPSQAVWLDADPTRLAQVFGNLLDNAAKYTPDGGRIGIRATLDHDRVMVCVEDNGTGVSPEELPEIFELFSQSDRGLDRSQGGLGIGLSVVRSLVEMHDGTVSAYSGGIGMGTCITVSLPVVPAPQGAVRKARVDPSHGQPLRILVVDDNVDGADSLAILLELAGHQVHAAYDGPGALEQCRLGHFDVVLLDIGLPGMDGYEVARQIRTMPAMAGAVLVAATGYGQATDVVRARQAGFDHHLVKPIEPERLAALLQQVRR